MRRNSFLVIGACVLIVGVVLGMRIESVVSSDNDYEQQVKLQEAFQILTNQYVEDVDSAKLSEDAIEGMLAGLDPHSSFINAEEMARVRENFNAEFEGIGISYEFTPGMDGKDSLTVLLPLVGGPSEQVGLLVGDRIIKVDGRDAVGWTRNEVEKYLKGPKGTKVTVTIHRPGYPRTLDFTITRDKIPIETITAHHMVDDRTGYIKLERFARTTHQEFVRAANTLKAQGMERLIFDLRGNPGGYLEMAIRISDEFLQGRQMIVYTQSRHSEFNAEYRAGRRGTVEDIPVIMLVNEGSASASEIVAGSAQDHDRALIVGRRSFGKGLVQRQYTFNDGSMLQMTISRYYTPVGRLIQTPYTEGERNQYLEHKFELSDQIAADVEAYLDQVPDSLKFKTDKGRTVLGGGGILPDRLVLGDTVSTLVTAVFRGGFDAAYARTILNEQSTLRDAWQDRQKAFNAEYTLSSTDWQGFVNHLDGEGIKFVNTLPEEPAEKTLYFTREELAANETVLRTRIKAYIARRIWGLAAWYPVIHSVDDTFQEAMRYWNNAERLNLDYTARRD